MPLTNTQYDIIMRIYDSERTANQHIWQTRYDEVLELCPRYHDIENEIVNISINAAAALIGSISQGNSFNLSDKLKELNQQKADCLSSIGKPADYLNPVYTCPKCKDTGYVGHSKCECFHQKAINLVYQDSNLKNITDDENFSTLSYKWYNNTTPNAANGLTPYKNMQQVVSICRDFVKNFDSSFENLLLFGNTGVGKTFLTNCIAKELLDSTHSVIYLTASELFKRFELHNIKHNYEDIDFNDYILDCDLLIIDDLGTEVTNSFTNSKLFYCINERILRKKSVIISTNLSLSDIRDTYSERILSRFTNSYHILKLFGEDIRMLKKKTANNKRN